MSKNDEDARAQHCIILRSELLPLGLSTARGWAARRTRLDASPGLPVLGHRVVRLGVRRHLAPR
jgi:hypothetical protein